MYNNNGRPLSKRQTLKIMVLLILLMWATQTLLAQWADGQEMKFVPSSSPRPAVIELRAEATIQGTEVRLKQIARWDERDNAAMAPAADLVVMRLSRGSPYRAITLDEVRNLLRDAGLNLATIRLGGSTRCTVARSDVNFNEGEALSKWLDARQAQSPVAPPAGSPVASKAVAAPAQTPPTVAVAPRPADAKGNPEPVRTLRGLISEDLATRLQLPADVLQITYAAKDDRVLNLVEGVFRFTLEAVRARDLGTVIYDVTLTNNGNSQKVTLQMTARAWQRQTVVTRPIPFKSVIRATDVETRRALVDRLSPDPVLARDQAVGQLAGRELKPGTVLTAKLVEAVPMVRTGQLVTITYSQGTVQLRSVARALEGGSFGQSIRCKNDTTGAVFEVVLTGPQAGTMNAAGSGKTADALSLSR